MKIQRVLRSTVIMIAVLSLAYAALAINLPDTGQTKCYQGVSPWSEIPCAGTGQDGAYNINPMSYTDNLDGTVTDNNTGLMWQQGENPTDYNWYQASGTYDATYNPTSQDVCGALTTGGYSDWRLPTKKELISIVDYSIPYPGPTITTGYFPYAYADSYYWSSTAYAEDPGYTWIVIFANGSVGLLGKDVTSYVRCVRGGQLNFGNFINNHDGTITDNSTSLMWQQSEPGYMTWQAALNYCEGLTFPSGGHSDWRLPNIKELESITDDTIYNPAIDKNFFPNAAASYYGSSTTLVPGSNGGGAGPDGEWVETFYNGTVYGYYGYKNVGFDVRCVRSGQPGSFGNLTITKTGTGTGTVTSNPAGINCGSDCSEAYNSNTVVTLTPTPSANSTFTGWSGDSDCSDGSVTMNADKTCTATFSKVKFEETDAAITYTGTWTNYTCAACSVGAVKYSGQSGAKASFTFTGRGIKWIAAKSFQLGKARVYIDNVLQTTVDLYSSTAKAKQVVYQKTGLTNSSHTIRIEFTGTKNLSSKGNAIDLDAFEVAP